MKRLIFLLTCLLPLWAMAQNKYTITGKVDNISKPSKAYLVYEMGGEQIMDSAVVNHGVFKFSGSVESPVVASIHLDHGNDVAAAGGDANAADILRLYVENADISLTSADSIKNATIKGSWVNSDNKQLMKQLQPYTDRMQALENEYQRKSPEQQQDPAYIQTLRDRAGIIEKEVKNVYIDFATKNTKSYIGLVAFRNYIADGFDVSTAEQQFEQFSEQVQTTGLGKAIAAIIRSNKYTGIGATAMDFTQNDVNDKPVKLSDFRGKYVLLDFWASWCGPCRAENPNIVAAYNKYKDKNFTVLGVSLDNPGKKEAWLKAIADDKLTWTQVSDLKSWNNEVARQWGIQSIPASFLIDPEGKIIAKNLTGAALLNKLEELLGNSASK